MEEKSSIELFEEIKVRITKAHANEEINIEEYKNWFAKFFSKISAFE
jgi:hypothetical protein